MSVLKRIFINRDYGLLLMGRLVSQIGDGVHYFAMAWLVLDLTGSGTALGTLLMAAAVPGIALAPFSGVLADIWDRKKIIVLMDLIRGALVLLLAAIYWLGKLNLPVLYIVTILLSLCGTLFTPAIEAAMPSLVKREELVQANARNTFSGSATGILGPVIGALLLAGFGYLGIFIIDGISYLLSALSELFIRFPEQKRAAVTNNPRTDFINNLKGGFRYLWQNPGLRVLMVGGIVLNFVFNPLLSVVLPFYGKEVLLMTPQHFGLAQSGFPAGMLLGTIFVGAMVARFNKLKLLLGGTAVQGGLLLCLGILALPVIYPQLSVLLTLAALALPLLLMGMANVQVNVPFNVMMQETVPEDYRGRVYALFGSTLNLAAPLGMGLFGLFLDHVPVHYFFLVCGTFPIIIVMILGRSTSLRTLYENTKEVETA